MAYQRRPLSAPRAAGAFIRMLTPMVEHPPLGGLLSAQLIAQAGVKALRRIPVSEPLPFDVPDLLPAPAPRRADGDALVAAAARLPGAAPGGFAFESAFALQRAFAEGATDPVRVGEQALAWMEEDRFRKPPLGIFVSVRPEEVRSQARESLDRLRSGQARSPLEGVPVAVKDELDVRGHRTRVGTSFLGETPAAEDAAAVAALRRAGAVILGKVNMHEIGIGVTGINPHFGPARNPYDPERFTGGSSSGPAAAVAAGLCPIAVGADGGGSIRIPAALCGVVGLKPTLGRVSEHGAAPLCWSVGHVGPLGATAADAALAYALMAGPDERDPRTLRQPEPSLEKCARPDLRGVRLGVYPEWFEDADPEIVAACRGMLERFRELGAEVRNIEIPELERVRPVHLVIIVSEMAASQLEHRWRHRRRYGHDTRLNLALGHRLKAADYVHALRLRARICAHFARALDGVDAIVTPATACTADRIRPDALKTGDSNLPLLERIMRFAQAANLTGLPAISFPAGYDGHGLPIGFQAMGRPFGEDLLLRLASQAERVLERRAPVVHHAYLTGSRA